MFQPGELESKAPRFDYNADFNLSVFGERYHFVLASSIWTRCSKRHIETMLDGFLKNTNPTAVFLTSFLPSESPEVDYLGDAWVGTSYESDTPGVIRHSLAWIQNQCDRRGLVAAQLPGGAFDGQFWLRIARGA